MDSFLFFMPCYQGVEEVAESEFLLCVKFSRIVNVMGISQVPGFNLGSRLPGTGLGPLCKELIVSHFKVLKKQRCRNRILSGFTISPQFPLACPSGPVDSPAFCVIHFSLLINGLLMPLLISLSKQSGRSAII